MLPKSKSKARWAAFVSFLKQQRAEQQKETCFKMRNVEKYTTQYFMPSVPCYDWTKKEYVEKAPIWCSVDLRDGNQALIVPMSLEEKLEFFKFLVEIGFKEIEVGFPAASETEYEFLRTLIERDMIPEDVTVQVLTQAREHIIRRTFEALEGCPRAIVHLYNSTSVAQREQVFRKSKEEIIRIAVDGAKLLQKISSEMGSNFRFEYSPESFTGTEMEFARDICNAVLDVWKPTPEKKVIINLPVTVEHSMPHVYACQVEYMCKHLDYRDSVVVSLHPHNDRGCGVADCELGLLAGADRIEGTLFGNGERTGNADIVTLALNMFSQGVDPKLNFEDMPSTVALYEKVTGMHVYDRQPYGGKLVFAAFSGSHQDAIAKGMKYRAKNKLHQWNVPYIPIDPKDIGRSYEAIIRVNSQSGKGGMAYLLKTNHNLDLPKRLQVEFEKVVQNYADETKKEVKDEDIWRLFKDEYLPVEESGATAAGVVGGDSKDETLEQWGRLKLLKVSVSSGEDGSDTVLKARILDRGVNVGVDEPVEREVSGIGNGPIAAFLNAVSNFGIEASVMDYVEHTMSVGTDAMAASYVECQIGEEDNTSIVWGVGIDTSIVTSSLKAIISAINRSER